MWAREKTGGWAITNGEGEGRVDPVDSREEGRGQIRKDAAAL